jgi:hypothetical protein
MNVPIDSHLHRVLIRAQNAGLEYLESIWGNGLSGSDMIRRKETFQVHGEIDSESESNQYDWSYSTYRGTRIVLHLNPHAHIVVLELNRPYSLQWSTENLLNAITKSLFTQHPIRTTTV